MFNHILCKYTHFATKLYQKLLKYDINLLQVAFEGYKFCYAESMANIY